MEKRWLEGRERCSIRHGSLSCSCAVHCWFRLLRWCGDSGGFEDDECDGVLWADGADECGV